jgi:hypothetical protein
VTDLLHASRATLPRVFWRRWAPVVGPQYATVIGRLRSGQIAAWTLFLLLLIYWVAFTYIVRGGGRILDRFWLPTEVLGVAAVLMHIYLLLTQNRFAQRLSRDLQQIGVTNRRMVSLTSLRSFKKWCANESVSSLQLIEAGALNSPVPPLFPRSGLR